MMVIMKPGHTAEEFEDVMKRIREDGLEGHPIHGVERTVIGVVGIDRLADLRKKVLLLLGGDLPHTLLELRLVIVERLAER